MISKVYADASRCAVVVAALVSARLQLEVLAASCAVKLLEARTRLNSHPRLHRLTPIFLYLVSLYHAIVIAVDAP